MKLLIQDFSHETGLEKGTDSFDLTERDDRRDWQDSDHTLNTRKQEQRAIRQ
jgi:hypothetical protein